jgi:ABC-2 type transport system permease protein
MIYNVFKLTMQELMGRRRLALVGLLALLPTLLAVAYRLGNQHTDPPQWTANVLLDSVILTILLPLVALIFGTSAIGSEIEDGTIVHLLAKPVSRREIILAKLASACLLTTLFVLPATALSGIVAIWGSAEQGIVIGFVIGSIAGALVYTSIFVMLSVLTSRALFVGLAYVFLWEGILTPLFNGTRYLSVHQCCLGVAALIVSAGEKTFSADVGGVESLIILAITLAGSVMLAVRLLESFEVGRND